MDAAENSEGAGTLQYLKTLDSIESKAEQLKVTFQEFYTSMGVEDVWKGALTVLTNFISNLNKMPKLLTGLNIIAFFTNAIAGIKVLITRSITSIAQIWTKVMGGEELSNTADILGKTWSAKLTKAMAKGWNYVKNKTRETSQEVENTVSNTSNNNNDNTPVSTSVPTPEQLAERREQEKPLRDKIKALTNNDEFKTNLATYQDESASKKDRKAAEQALTNSIKTNLSGSIFSKSLEDGLKLSSILQNIENYVQRVNGEDKLQVFNEGEIQRAQELENLEKEKQEQQNKIDETKAKDGYTGKYKDLSKNELTKMQSQNQSELDRLKAEQEQLIQEAGGDITPYEENIKAAEANLEEEREKLKITEDNKRKYDAEYEAANEAYKRKTDIKRIDKDVAKNQEKLNKAQDKNTKAQQEWQTAEEESLTAEKEWEEAQKRREKFYNEHSTAIAFGDPTATKKYQQLQEQENEKRNKKDQAKNNLANKRQVAEEAQKEQEDAEADLQRSYTEQSDYYDSEKQAEWKASRDKAKQNQEEAARENREQQRAVEEAKGKVDQAKKEKANYETKISGSSQRLTEVNARIKALEDKGVDITLTLELKDAEEGVQEADSKIDEVQTTTEAQRQEAETAAQEGRSLDEVEADTQEQEEGQTEEENRKNKIKTTIGNVATLVGSLASVAGQFIDTSTREGEITSGIVSTAGGLASAAGQALAGNWVGAVVTAVTTGLNFFDIFNETAAEKLEKATKAAEEAENKALEAKDAYNTLDDNLDNLKELEKAQYDSEDAAEEYHSAMNDLAADYPELIKMVDENGNAIIDAGAAEAKLAELRKASAQATAEAAVKEADRIQADINADVEELDLGAVEKKWLVDPSIDVATNTATLRNNEYYSSGEDADQEEKNKFYYEEYTNGKHGTTLTGSVMERALKNGGTAVNDAYKAANDVNDFASRLTAASLDEDEIAFWKKLYTEDQTYQDEKLGTSGLTLKQYEDQASNAIQNFLKVNNDDNATDLEKSNALAEAISAASTYQSWAQELGYSGANLFNDFIEITKDSALTTQDIAEKTAALKGQNKLAIGATLNAGYSWKDDSISGIVAADLTNYRAENAQEYSEKTTEEYLSDSAVTDRLYKNKQILEDYYNGLTSSQKEIWSTLLEDTSGKYNADTIIAELGLNENNDEDQKVISLIRGYYADTDEAVYERMRNKYIRDENGNNVEEINNGKYEIDSKNNTGADEIAAAAWNATVNGGGKLMSSMTENFINEANEFVESYDKQGFGQQSQKYGNAFLGLYNRLDDIAETDTQLAQDTLAQLDDADLTSWSGIQSAIKAIEDNKELSKDQKTAIKTQLERMQEAIVQNVYVELQTISETLTTFASEGIESLTDAAEGLDISKALEFYNNAVDQGMFDDKGFDQIFEQSQVDPTKYVLKDKSSFDEYINNQLGETYAHLNELQTNLVNDANRLGLTGENYASGNLGSDFEGLKNSYNSQSSDYDSYDDWAASQESDIFRLASSYGFTEELEAYITGADEGGEKLKAAMTEAFQGNDELVNQILASWENIAQITGASTAYSMGLGAKKAISELTKTVDKDGNLVEGKGFIDAENINVGEILQGNTSSIEGLSDHLLYTAISYAEQDAEKLQGYWSDFIGGDKNALTKANAELGDSLGNLDDLFNITAYNYVEKVDELADLIGATASERNEMMQQAYEQYDTVGKAKNIQSALGNFQLNSNKLFTSSYEDLLSLADSLQVGVSELNAVWNSATGQYEVNWNKVYSNGEVDADTLTRTNNKLGLDTQDTQSSLAQDVIDMAVSEGLSQAKKLLNSAGYESLSKAGMTAQSTTELVENLKEIGMLTTEQYNSAMAEAIAVDNGDVRREAMESLSVVNGMLSGSLEDIGAFLEAYGIELEEGMVHQLEDGSYMLTNVDMSGVDEVKKYISNKANEMRGTYLSEFTSFVTDLFSAGKDISKLDLTQYGNLTSLIGADELKDVSADNLGEVLTILNNTLKFTTEEYNEALTTIVEQQEKQSQKALNDSLRDMRMIELGNGKQYGFASTVSDVEAVAEALGVGMDEISTGWNEELQGYAIDIAKVTKLAKDNEIDITNIENIVQTGIETFQEGVTQDIGSLIEEIISEGFESALETIDKYENLRSFDFDGYESATGILDAFGGYFADSIEDLNNYYAEAAVADLKSGNGLSNYKDSQSGGSAYNIEARDAISNLTFNQDQGKVFASDISDLVTLAASLGVSMAEVTYYWSEELQSWIAEIDDNSKLGQALADNNFSKEMESTTRTLISDITGYVSDALSGSLSFDDQFNLEASLKKLGFNVGDLDFTETTDGFKLAETSAWNIYKALRDSGNEANKIAAKSMLKDMAENAQEADESLENIYTVISRIEAIEKEINSGNVSDKRKEQLEAELGICKEIKSELEAAGEAFNFMEGDLPTGMTNPNSAWEGMGDAFTVFNGDEFKKGRMDFTDFYNMVNMMTSAGVTLKNGSQELALDMTTSSKLIQAAASSMKMIDGESFVDMDALTVNLSNLGINFEMGANSMQEGVTDGIHEIAQSQIDMLDTAIAMLDTIAAMEEIGDVAGDDGVLSLDEVFGKSVDGDGFTSEWSETLHEITKALEEANVDLDETYIAGHSLRDWLTKTADELGVSKEKYLEVFQALYDLSNGDFDPNNMSSILEQWGQSMDGLFSMFTEEGGVIAIDGQSYSFEYDEQFEELAKSFFGSQENAIEKIKEYASTKGKGMDPTEVSQVLQLIGAVEVTPNEDGDEYSYKGVYVGKGEAGKQAVEDMIKIDANNRLGGTIEAGEKEGTYTIEYESGNTVTVEKTVDGWKYTYVDQDGHTGTGTTEEEAILAAAKAHKAETSGDSRNGAKLTDEEKKEAIVNATGETQITTTTKGNIKTTQAALEAVSGMEADENGNITVDGTLKGILSDAGVEVIGNSANQESLIEILGGETKFINFYGTYQGDELATSLLKLVESYGAEGVSIPVNLLFNNGDGTSDIEDGSTVTFTVQGIEQIETLLQVLNDTDLHIIKIQYQDAEGNPITLGTPTGNLNTTLGLGASNPSLSGATLNVTGSTVEGDWTVPDMTLSGSNVNITGDATVNGSCNCSGGTTGNPGGTTGGTGDTSGGSGGSGNNNNENTGNTSTAINAFITNLNAAMPDAGLQAGASLGTAANIGANTAKDAIKKAFKDTMDGITGKTVTITVNYPKEITINAKVNVSGVPNAKGTIRWSDGHTSSFAKGNAMAAGNTLMGELGPELVVSNGHYFTVGENGPEFVDLASDAIVFNHLQTRQLLNNGSASTYGKPVTNERKATSFAKGNAMASASEAAAQLRTIRAQWQRLLDMSASDFGKKAGSGGGGGGGGEDEGAVIGEYERWYNLLRQIEHYEKEISLEQARRENMIDGSDYANSLEKELEILKKQKSAYSDLTNLQRDFYNQRRKDLDASEYSKIFTYDENGLMQYVDGENKGLDILATLNATDVNGKAKMDAKQQIAYLKSIGFDTSVLNYDASGKAMKGDSDKMQVFWDSVDSWIEEMDSLYDDYHDHAEALEETISKMNEIIQEYIDKQLSVEEALKTAIEDREQAIIDKLEDQKEALENAASAYTEGLSSALDKEKSLYDNEESQAETQKLQRQLAILQRSGGSASEIKSLQDQLDSRLKDDYFNKMQEQIDAIQDASDKEIERLDKQIEIANTALDYQKENGLLWQEVYNMMDKWNVSKLAAFVASNTASYKENSALQNSEDLKEFKTNAGVYVANRDSDSTRKAFNELYQRADTDGNLLFKVDNTAYDSDTATKAYEAYASEIATSGDEGKAKDAADAIFKEREDWAVEQFNKKAKALGLNEETDSKIIDEGKKELDKTLSIDDALTAMRTTALEVLKGKNPGKVGGQKTAVYKSASLSAKTWGTAKANAPITSDGDFEVGEDKDGKAAVFLKCKWGKNTGYISADNLAWGDDTWSRYKNLLTGYATGGLNTSTGPAMLHGTSSKPEAILNATDTKFFREQLFGNGDYSLRKTIEAVQAMQSNLASVSENNVDNSTYYNFNGIEIKIESGVISSDYDAQTAGDKIMEQLTALARKSQNIGVSRR